MTEREPRRLTEKDVAKLVIGVTLSLPLYPMPQLRDAMFMASVVPTIIYWGYRWKTGGYYDHVRQMHGIMKIPFVEPIVTSGNAYRRGRLFIFGRRVGANNFHRVGSSQPHGSGV